MKLLLWDEKLKYPLYVMILLLWSGKRHRTGPRLWLQEAIIICLIQYFKADFLWKVSLKILNSGLILKTFTYAEMLVKAFVM